MSMRAGMVLTVIVLILLNMLAYSGGSYGGRGGDYYDEQPVYEDVYGD